MPTFEDPRKAVAGLETLSDRELLTCTLFGEIRGQSTEAVIGVGSVIMNRVHDGRYGRGLAGVVLRRKAFSCWWEVSKNRTEVLTMAGALCRLVRFPTLAMQLSYRRLFSLAPGIMDGSLRASGFHAGVLHYHAIPLNQPERWPKWARGVTPIASIDGTHFFENIDG